MANTTVTDSTLPEGCLVQTNADGTATAIYNMGKSVVPCATSGAKSAGQAGTAVGVTLGLSMLTAPGPFLQSSAGVYCSSNHDNILESFVAASPDVTDSMAALAACEKFCAANATCQFCSVDMINPSTTLCQWNAIPACGNRLTWAGKIPGDISQKTMTGGNVTITLSGPADVW